MNENSGDAGKRATETTYQKVCSPRPRAAIKGRGNRGQFWKREPFHVFAGEGRTFCGRDSREWLDMGLSPKREILSHHECCERCKQALVNRDGASNA